MKHQDSAFPIPNSDLPNSNYPEAGMTQRMYYKAAALQGMCGRYGDMLDVYVSFSAAIADAMIAEDEAFHLKNSQNN